jgi:hypothetical protein
VRRAGARYLDEELERELPGVHVRRAPGPLARPPRPDGDETVQPPRQAPAPALVPADRSS